MSFISPAAHQKFVLQCQSLIGDKQQADARTARLQADLAQLQRLAEAYLQTVSQLPGLTREYNELQRRIRIHARKMQPLKTPGKSNKQL